MSALQGISQIIQQLRSAIGSEKDRLEKDLESSIRRIVSDTSNAYKTVFDDIMSALQSSGEIVKSDVEMIDSAVASVIKKMEAAAEGAFSTFKRDVEGTMTKLKGIAADAIQGVSNATAYIRNSAYEEFDAAISKARADFDAFKTRFKDTIAAIGVDVISKTKAGVAAIVSSMQSDIDRLKKMKDTIENDISMKFEEVKVDLVALKDAASKDMERIVGFIRNELDKLETRVDKMAAKVDRIGYVFTGVAIVVSIAASTLIIADAKREIMQRDKHK